QYSDSVTFKATITPGSVNGYSPATSVTFMVGTQTMSAVPVALTPDGSGGLTASLTASLLQPSPYGTAPTGQMAPGSHTVTAQFNGLDTTHFQVNPTATTSLTIAQ